MQLPIGRLLVGDFTVTKDEAVAATHRTRSCRHAVRLSSAFMASAGGNFTRPRTAATVICSPRWDALSTPYWSPSVRPSKSEACGTISTMQWLQPFGSLMTSFPILSLPGRPRNLAIRTAMVMMLRLLPPQPRPPLSGAAQHANDDDGATQPVPASPTASSVQTDPDRGF